MFKALFLAVCSMIFFASASADLYARSYLTHADFFQLTTEKKNEHVIKLMKVS